MQPRLISVEFRLNDNGARCDFICVPILLSSLFKRVRYFLLKVASVIDKTLDGINIIYTSFRKLI